MRRNKFLLAVTAVAVLSSGLTWVLGQQIQSPAERAATADPPEASLLTVPIKSQQLDQTVVTRGTVKPSDFVDVTATSAEGSKVVITGLPKEAGDEVAEGDVVTEVSGRPIFALQGTLPTFRDFRPGVIGPDVTQLEESLSRLGYNPGTIDDTYDSGTANAVAALYKAKGYPAKGRSDEDQQALQAAKQFVTDSEIALAEAKKQVTEATKGPSKSERLQLDQAVAQAESELANAQAAAADDPSPEAKQAVSTAKANVELAKAQRDEGLATPDASEARNGVTRAEKALAAAKTEQTRIQNETGTSLPSAEVVFVTNLPQQVIRVDTKLGATPSGSVLTISGSDTVIRSAISSADRKLLSEGMSATIDQEELGLDAAVKVSKIAAQPGGGDLQNNQYAVEFTANEPLPEDAIDISVRITIPVTSSDGEVLTVPLAAVSAGPDGTARIEIERTEGETETVNVAVGLTADGQVEISGLAGQDIQVGDRVVVGRDQDSSESDDETESDDE